MKSPPNFRRLASGVCLTISLLMLVPGLTFVPQRLSPLALAVYWLVCFLLTGFAAIIALIDLMLLRRELRDQQRDLMKSTFDDIGPNPDDESECRE